MSLSVLSLTGTEGRSFIVTCQTQVKSVKGKLIRELNVLMYSCQVILVP